MTEIEKNDKVLCAYNDEQAVGASFILEGIDSILDEIKVRVAWFDDNARLEDIRKVFNLTCDLYQAVAQTEENSLPQIMEIPKELWEKAKSYMQEHTCTIPELQRELKIGYPMASKLWEEFRK